MIACDLGSNTLRIVLFDCKNKIRLKEFERTVRTAHNLHKNGFICDASIQKIYQALKEAQDIFDFQTNKVYAVCTEAMRQASNSSDIIDKIFKDFGINFKIIDGDEEARLTRLAVEFAMQKEALDINSYTLMDLGGASTEISIINHAQVISKSFTFGILTLAQRYERFEQIQKGIMNDLQVLDDFIKGEKLPSKYFIATAGTPTSVCAFLLGMDYASYDHSQINGKKLTLDDFTRALEALLSMNKKDQEFWVGTSRGDLVCTGILITQEIMRKMGFFECIVIDDSLKEGLALEKCNTLKSF